VEATAVQFASAREAYATLSELRRLSSGSTWGDMRVGLDGGAHLVIPTPIWGQLWVRELVHRFGGSAEIEHVVAEALLAGAGPIVLDVRPEDPVLRGRVESLIARVTRAYERPPPSRSAAVRAESMRGDADRLLRAMYPGTSIVARTAPDMADGPPITTWEIRRQARTA
jgi:hypothetical protein